MAQLELRPTSELRVFIIARAINWDFTVTSKWLFILFLYFRFEESDHSRQEEADANGNIKGKYSYKNSEGNDIVVQYSAGPNQGFVIENQEELAQSVSKATLDAAEVQKSRNIDEVEKTNGIYF